MKYSINSAGRIVAERDIYSLGGFIPKGELGGFIADETQLSQEGECWLDSGDISGRPDIVIKDNAYVGNFVGSTGMHTDGVTEFSGNTIVPGAIIVRNPIADPVNNFYAKDSFIGISMDVLCGPRTTTTAFPFEQGGYVPTAPRGTAFSSVVMQTGDTNICRSTDSVIRCGLNTYVYLPTGYSGRILWSYTQGGTAVYSGESKVIPSGLTKIEHPVYKRFMLHITKIDGTAMTPANLLATGAKILGHISSSANVDIRPESASGSYVMDKSSFLINTDDFGLNTTQLRFLAGSMYDTTMYTKTDRQDYKLYGTFRNVERLEYTKRISDSYRTAATRDTYISAYDCPLLRVDNATYNDSLAAEGNLTLRGCIVPKAYFTHDVVNGNTYEGIDFSYANEFIGNIVAGKNLYSSHREGLYACESNGELFGLISYPGNMDDKARMAEALVTTMLDGNIIEQGTYYGALVHYEANKYDNPTRVRTIFPLPTRGAKFPVIPAGFGVRAILYLDDNFVCKLAVTDPTTIESTYPYYVMAFKRDNLSAALTTKDFIALGASLRSSNYNVTPEITGSAYVGAGCIVRGDVQLHGDPYVNRLLDVNMWERGNCQPTQGGKWQDGFFLSSSHNTYRLKDLLPVEPGGTVSQTAGGKMVAWFFDEFGNRTSSAGTGWVSSFVIPANVYFVGIVLNVDGGGLIVDSDIPLANVKYVRAFKKRRYIVNELDRTSPEDILLSVDYWEQGTAGGGQADAGKTYEELKATSGTTIRLKRPINVSPSSSISSASGFSRYIRVLDAVTKFHLGESLNSAKMALLAVIIQKDPSAAITPPEIPNSRLVLEFVPQPRIIAPYGVSNVWIEGTKVRMYDNSVISRTITQGQEVTLKGDAVMGTVFIGDVCICSNGYDDAIIKLP